MAVNTAPSFSADIEAYIADQTLPLTRKQLVAYQFGDPLDLPKGRGTTYTATGSGAGTVELPGVLSTVAGQSVTDWLAVTTPDIEFLVGQNSGSDIAYISQAETDGLQIVNAAFALDAAVSTETTLPTVPVLPTTRSGRWSAAETGMCSDSTGMLLKVAAAFSSSSGSRSSW